MLHLDFPDLVSLEHYRVEKLRVLHRKQQKRQGAIRQGLERILRKPNRIGQSYYHGLCGADDATGPENCVTETFGIRLNDIGDLSAGVAIAEVAQNVGFTRLDYKADLVGATQNHALDEVLRGCTSTLHAV